MCLIAQAGDLVLRGPVEDVARVLRHGVHDHEVAEALEQILHEPPRILSCLDHAVDGAEHRGGVAGGEGVDDVVEKGPMGVAEQRAGQVVADLILVGAGHELIQHGEGVAHGAAAGADHHGLHAGLHAHALLLAQGAEVLHERLGRDQAERVVVRAGADGRQDLVRLRGGEDELDVLRRLLDDLQQRVEAVARDHVGLVDDEDLVPVPDRGERGALAQLAGVVHAAVGGGVHLDDVQGAGAVAGQIAAGLALPAGRGRGALSAVEAARQDARRGGLAAASRAGEQVGVVHLVLAQRGHQRLGHMGLTDDVLERLRAVAAVQGGRHTDTVATGSDVLSGGVGAVDD